MRRPPARCDNRRMSPEPVDRIAEVTKAGVAAALAVARDQGLPADDPRLLSSRGNVVVHLAPAPVVARVATLTGWTRDDPFRWMEREVTVAGHLANRGAPVAAPTPLADPGPHRSSAGLAVSLWTLVTATSSVRPSPVQVGRALARLHAAGADLPGRLPLLTPARDLITEGLAILARHEVLDADTITVLRGHQTDLLAEIEATACAELPVLHGDAHPGNVLMSGSGCVWIDLEESCRGPREFDLAVMLLSYAEPHQADPGGDGLAALAAYADVAGIPVPDPRALVPFARTRELEAVVWLTAMAFHYPSRYAEHARRRIASFVR